MICARNYQFEQGLGQKGTKKARPEWSRFWQITLNSLLADAQSSVDFGEEEVHHRYDDQRKEGRERKTENDRP